MTLQRAASCFIDLRIGRNPTRPAGENSWVVDKQTGRLRRGGELSKKKGKDPESYSSQGELYPPEKNTRAR